MKKLQEFDAKVHETVDGILREERKQSFFRRMIKISEDVPLLPNFIGKPFLGIIGLSFDAIKASRELFAHVLSR